jgi:heme-degrading monooxygenase HmoA
MIVRLWRAGIDPARLADYERFERTTVLEMFRKQPGFLGMLFLRAGSECQTLTLWTDAAAVAALTASASYKETVDCLLKKGLLRGEPTVEIFTGVGGMFDPVALRLYFDSRKDGSSTEGSSLCGLNNF